MEYGQYFGQKLWFKHLDVFVSYKDAAFLHKMLIDGLESCGLLWCFYQLFGLSFWRHPFGIHWLASDVMLNFSKSVLMKKQTH